MDQLQGTWAITALEAEGDVIPPAVFGASKIVVDGDRFTTVSMGAVYSGTVRIDATAIPMTLDLLFTDGPHNGTASLGIFTLAGDAWTICLGFAGRDRPTAFRTTPGSGHALESLRRETRSRTERAPAPPPPTSPYPPTSPAQPAAATAEMAPLAGTWSAVSIESNGAPLPEMIVKTGKRVVTGNELTVTVGGQVQLHVTFSVNPATTPPSIDYTIIDGPDKGRAMPGIYELHGDTLRTCFVQPGQPRPATFETRAGDSRTLSVWRRQAP